MARSGPVTIDSSTVPIGLAQIRVIDSATHIKNIMPKSVAGDSIGALANTKFVGEVDWFDLESGFPLQRDATWAIRENARMEVGMKEATPYNLALAHGIDPIGSYTDPHSGEIKLGNRKAPDYVRMEAVYTYPNGTDHMYIIFPRANVKASVEIDFQAEENAVVPVVFESTNADSNVVGGDAVWDDMSLGRIAWD